MYQDIVVPTDGSKASENAVEYAVELADGRDATIHVLYVINDSIFGRDMENKQVPDEVSNEAHEATRRIKRLVEEYDERSREENFVTMEEVREGTPHEEITGYADEVDADAIVMSTHGRTGLSKFMLGSVTQRVITHSDVPVMTAPYEEE